MFAHVDQSYTGAYEVLADNISPPSESELLSKTRFAIINVWRPIRQLVPHGSLAVCDARSVQDSDLHEILAVLPKKGHGTFDKISKGDGFYIWYIVYNPSYRWYYASQMRPDEVLCIKCFDSKTDGTARRSPHSALQTEGQDERAPAREIIEVNCLVFWEDNSVE
ncbi:hypothetical protein LTR12_014805 [Friedmanniomyces endolithicus]|nr:hypothetical protein LTR12_014805 [Friedmanniomyces endolithicus]